MDAQELKAQAHRAIDQSAASVEAYLADIHRRPELGFAEFRTASKMAEFLGSLNLPVRTGLAVTGVEAVLDTGSPGPTVALMGELDAIVCAGAPAADPVTGAAHHCGHDIQQAVMLAAAAGLAKAGIAGQLSGQVKFLGTPAEEMGQFDLNELRAQGKVQMPSGKAELIRLGIFDDVDMAMQMHCWSHRPGSLALRLKRNLAIVCVSARYRGRQAHAASEAFNGINALYAAMTGVNAVNLLRETFKDSDVMKVHCVMPQGGSNPNSIPDCARVDVAVKANSVPALDALLERVIRALRYGAQALGAAVEIDVAPGSLPFVTDEILSDLYEDNARAFIPPAGFERQDQQYACSDLGDVSQLMPVAYPQCGGITGVGHGTDFAMADFTAAVLIPAKAFAGTVIDLLAGDAALARRVKAEHKPNMTKTQYLAAMERYFAMSDAAQGEKA